MRETGKGRKKQLYKFFYTITDKTTAGSFTIEAAVVVPVSMIIIMSVIFLSFYVYDQAVMTAESDYALLSEADGIAGDTDGTAEGISAVLGSKLIAASDISVSISGDENHAQAVSFAVFEIPLSMIDLLLDNSLTTVSFHMDIGNLRGRKKLLLYKSICDGSGALIAGDG